MSRETLLRRPEGEESSLTSSPCALGDTFCGGTDLTSSPFGMAFCDATTPIGLRNSASVPGCTVSTMVLSEALGLRLYRVIRGGIGLSQRLGAGGHHAYRPSSYSPSNPSVSQNRLAVVVKIGERQRFLCRDAQAACCFSFSASKLSPFFQSVSVIAAIFRANVSRAMAGFMPLASNPR